MFQSIKSATHDLVKQEIEIAISEARSDGPAEVFGKPSLHSQAVLLGAHKALLEMARDIERQLTNFKPDLKDELDSHK